MQKYSMAYYIITGVQDGSQIDENALAIVTNYSKHLKAKLLVFRIKGLYVEDAHSLFTGVTVLDTDICITKGLKVVNTGINVSTRRPLSGISEFSGRYGSAIIPFPRMDIAYEPTSNRGIPAVTCCSGVINKKHYKSTKSGKLASKLHKLGFTIVEVVKNGNFHIRQVEIADGVAYDLNKCITPKGITNVKSIPAIVGGDRHVGVQDDTACTGYDKLIQLLKPSRIYEHDFGDNSTINHHARGKLLDQIASSTGKFKSLEEELRYVHKYLVSLAKRHKNVTINIVESNHDSGFLLEWLNSKAFVDEYHNTIFGCELLKRVRQYGNPAFKHALEIIGPLPTNVKFLVADEEVLEKGYDVGRHFNTSNGGRAGYMLLHRTMAKSISAHTHSPSRYDDVVTVGCLCLLYQSYTRLGISSWVHSCAPIYPNGTVQLINFINGKFVG